MTVHNPSENGIFFMRGNLQDTFDQRSSDQSESPDIIAWGTKQATPEEIDDLVAHYKQAATKNVIAWGSSMNIVYLRGKNPSNNIFGGNLKLYGVYKEQAHSPRKWKLLGQTAHSLAPNEVAVSKPVSIVVPISEPTANNPYYIIAVPQSHDSMTPFNPQNENDITGSFDQWIIRQGFAYHTYKATKTPPATNTQTYTISISNIAVNNSASVPLTFAFQAIGFLPGDEFTITEPNYSDLTTHYTVPANSPQVSFDSSSVSVRPNYNATLSIRISLQPNRIKDLTMQLTLNKVTSSKTRPAGPRDAGSQITAQVETVATYQITIEK